MEMFTFIVIHVTSISQLTKAERIHLCKWLHAPNYKIHVIVSYPLVVITFGVEKKKISE